MFNESLDGGKYDVALSVPADDYWLSFQFWVKRLLHGNEEGIQINMEDTASHEIVYKLARLSPSLGAQ